MAPARQRQPGKHSHAKRPSMFRQSLSPSPKLSYPGAGHCSINSWVAHLMQGKNNIEGAGLRAGLSLSGVCCRTEGQPGWSRPTQLSLKPTTSRRPELLMLFGLQTIQAVLSAQGQRRRVCGARAIHSATSGQGWGYWQGKTHQAERKIGPETGENLPAQMPLCPQGAFDEQYGQLMKGPVTIIEGGNEGGQAAA